MQYSVMPLHTEYAELITFWWRVAAVSPAAYHVNLLTPYTITTMLLLYMTLD